MYYGLIVLSVVMFGGCFALNDIYRKKQGSGLGISMQFSFSSSLAGLAVLMLFNGINFEFTWFTFVMALLTAVNGFAFTYCGFKALGSINLSLYSLFSMLGGMVLPFVQGIVFYGEQMTVAKGVCFVFICAALLLTVEKGERTKGTWYYVGIFVLNGMAGVLSKIFAAAPFEKASAAGFSALSALCSVVIAGVYLLLFGRRLSLPKLDALSIGISAAGGMTNRIANFVLVLALAHVDASVQYPMVTGGVMIVSTLICCFGKVKPSKKEFLSVAVAFVGLLALFLIKI